MASNEEILGEKKDWEIFCHKCDAIIPLRNITKWRADHMLQMYIAMKGKMTSPCDHQIALREVA